MFAEMISASLFVSDGFGLDGSVFISTRVLVQLLAFRQNIRFEKFGFFSQINQNRKENRKKKDKLVL